MTVPSSTVPTAIFNSIKEEAQKVMIGVDPHEGSHTAVAVDDGESELARVKVRTSSSQLDELLT